MVQRTKTSVDLNWTGTVQELPEGVLHGLSPEQVLQYNSEGDFLELVTMALDFCH